MTASPALAGVIGRDERRGRKIHLKSGRPESGSCLGDSWRKLAPPGSGVDPNRTHHAAVLVIQQMAMINKRSDDRGIAEIHA